MSSTGGKIDHSINRGGDPYCFKVLGVNYHNIGSLVLTDDNTPKFCQLYIYDTEDKINNRINAVNGCRDVVNEEIVQVLLHMLDEHNKLVKGFRMARERVRQNAVDEFKLVLISSSSASGRPNHIAPSNERIFETDPRFMQLQYPLLFPYGDIGYYREIPLNRPVKHSKRDVEVIESEDPDEKGARKYIIMREFYNYKLMIRLSEGLTPHLGGRLWQQYVVDAFTAIEQYRLDWIRDHQTTIRSGLYHNIRDAMQKGDRNPSNIGKSIILPASFTESKRYMTQYFKDSLPICRTLGHPSLFLTMTTNTKWPEIQRMLKHMSGVDVADALDVVARVFKMKVDQLMDMIKKKNCFGRCIGVMHVIEFQKRGLPHAHILIWLHPDDRPKITGQIDKMVSAEIPDPEIDPVGYNAVSNYMIHGPCGPDYTKSPCMVKGSCIKHFPKRYNSHTFFDECGFPIYKRRRIGITINKKGVNLDNRFIVPFNRDLLVHFQCQMNLEICNNLRSLKYLCKYCLKGHDTTTICLRKTCTSTSATIPKKKKGLIDEVKHYLDGRYVCALEASCWIFAFDIHSRWPSVERLPIHLPGEKHVSFNSGDVLEDVCDKTFPNARNYSYSEFPNKFTWHRRPGIWKERKRGDVIGRLSEVHSSSGELLYLRMLLLRKKGSMSFEDLKTVNGHIHEIFKKACATLGLLQNDNQGHEAIAENSHTSLPPQLRAMFVNILAYSPISDPLRLWEANWQCMSDDILIIRRHMLNDPHLYLSDEDLKNYALADLYLIIILPE
ncbi:uncharacterized protein LOC141665994 [Apium graveolens]|uniref:uncharacterized protein LOC141665994 n=1 Tax=Apium graveolens TaxID=4045 RepID=UPI003D78BDA0